MITFVGSLFIIFINAVLIIIGIISVYRCINRNYYEFDNGLNCLFWNFLCGALSIALYPLHELISSEKFSVDVIIFLLILFLCFSIYYCFKTCEFDKIRNNMNSKQVYEDFFNFMPKYFVIRENTIDLLIEQNIEKKIAYCEIIKWMLNDHFSYNTRFLEGHSIVRQFIEEYDSYIKDNALHKINESDLYKTVTLISDALNCKYKKYTELCDEINSKHIYKNLKCKIAALISNILRYMYREYINLCNKISKKHVKKNQDNKINESDCDEFLKDFKNDLNESFINSKEFNDSINKISNIVNEINKKVGDNQSLKSSASLNRFMVYHNELLELLKNVQKIETSKYKTEDMIEKVKSVKEMINNSMKFYEDELNKLYNAELMNIEVTVKLFKSL